MKISFVINEPIQSASGGYKMVYIYANELVEKEHDVTIYYHCHRDVLFSNYKLPFWTKMTIANVLSKTGPKWFELDKRVGRKVIRNVTDKNVADGDIVIATAANTADDVYKLSETKGKKFYFIQGYEDWIMSADELARTYGYPMTKITVSSWLKNVVEKYTEDPIYCVLNGIRNDVFFVSVQPSERTVRQISMLYHNLESKGSKEGLSVIYKLKKEFPDLQAHLFGIVDKPENLPDWIKYTQNASQKELNNIYNASQIYLCPSWNEGFGLTGAESMMCGCVLVTTKTKGSLEYADDTNAMLVEIHDTNQMYDACKNILENGSLRIEIAEKGAADVSSLLNYKNSVDRMISILTEK